MEKLLENTPSFSLTLHVALEELYQIFFPPVILIFYASETSISNLEFGKLKVPLDKDMDHFIHGFSLLTILFDFYIHFLLHWNNHTGDQPLKGFHILCLLLLKSLSYLECVNRTKFLVLLSLQNYLILRDERSPIFG